MRPIRRRKVSVRAQSLVLSKNRPQRREHRPEKVFSALKIFAANGALIGNRRDVNNYTYSGARRDLVPNVLLQQLGNIALQM
jgi:hypothetical protein